MIRIPVRNTECERSEHCDMTLTGGHDNVVIYDIIRSVCVQTCHKVIIYKEKNWEQI